MSSRICVKNIPKYAKEDRLREFFSQKGEITDVKIMRTTDHKSRQFAFIGFRTEQEAEEAIRFFNNSYLDTCRITCEVARKVGDASIPRPWSKHSLKKCDTQVKGNKDIGGTKSEIPNSNGQNFLKKLPEASRENLNDDPQLREFLEIMQPRVKSKLWANDTIASLPVDQDVKADLKSSSGPDKKDVDGKVSACHDNIKEKATNKNADSSNEHGKDGSLDMGKAKDDDISDMDYFRSRVKKKWSDTESDNDEESIGEGNQDMDAQGDNVPKMEEAHDAACIQQVDTKEKPSLGISDSEKTDHDKPSSTHNDDNDLDTGRLFVRNLPYTTSEDELLDFFSKFGDVTSVHLVVDKETKRSKGVGYVLYKLPESAYRALEELDSSIFQGRLLHILPAKPQNLPVNKSQPDSIVGQGAKSFKQKREEQKKKSEVAGDTKSWNTLFMRPDTVVENIARKYGVNKSDLLDREADDLAVRLALGETHVIAETKKALAIAGVNVNVLEEFASKKIENTKRSNDVILVKNLPFGSCEGDLAKMFGQFGSVDKIILPPTKALALVVFLEPAEARAAFRGLAYKRYKDAPLYLEWAPGDILLLNNETNQPKNIVGEDAVKRELVEQTMAGVPETDLDPDRIESRSVFVKNLNFKTSDESLRKHFNNITKKGKIQCVKIKKHEKNGKNVSMGYGFIEFDSLETATAVCRDFQGTVLDGFALILQLCRTKSDSHGLKKVDNDRSSTKLIVRNVAFEATEKDLRQLFSPFGQIRSIRLPMKFGGHRGFAFVEYITKQEARNALEALSSTHLYGRHLVLEQAKEGESLEELRARTAAQFSEDGGLQKLSKKRKHIALFDEGRAKFENIID